MHWQPPKEALEKVIKQVWDPSVSRYGADEGIPQLREALIKKVNGCFQFGILHLEMGLDSVY